MLIDSFIVLFYLLFYKTVQLLLFCVKLVKLKQTKIRKFIFRSIHQIN